jgi:predicted DNA-binding transcriptional regulator YafY
MADALLRHWCLLQAIPRAPARRDVTTLHRTLEQAGYRITRRQLQRDLNSLSTVFPLQADERGPAFGWSWAKDAAIMDLPSMDPRTALMLTLVQRFIPELLPAALSDQLQPYFKKATQVLKSGPGGRFGRWTELVRVVPREMPLLPPKCDPAASRVVYDALLAGKRLMAHYASRSVRGGDPGDYEISPLALVLRGNLMYLVCTLWDYADPRQLALHRLTCARMLDKSVTRPRGFDLDEYIQQQEFQYPVGPMITLKVIFDKGVGAHLAETPLSDDQVLKDIDDTQVTVTATVRDSQGLEWWLRSFGDAAEVLAPTDLRLRLAATFRRAAGRYDDKKLAEHRRPT